MVNFEALYYKLFGNLADAVELLEQGRPQAAKQLRISAMQQAEEQYLQEEE